jgi:hypothetical protein
LLLVTCLVAANNGPRDPFVEVVQGDATKLATPAQENAGSNPSWDVNLKLDTNPAALDEEPLKIRVKDGNGASKDRVLGRGRVNPDDAVSGPGDWMDITGDLLDGDGKPAGEYHLKARYRPKSQIPPLSTEPGVLEIQEVGLKNLPSPGSSPLLRCPFQA